MKGEIQSHGLRIDHADIWIKQITNAPPDQLIHLRIVYGGDTPPHGATVRPYDSHRVRRTRAMHTKAGVPTNDTGIARPNLKILNPLDSVRKKIVGHRLASQLE
jgi:hypothetical protein